MRVAVAGCGITGATVAFFLAEAGHQVTVFEQAPVSQPKGAGIMLQPSGQAILQEMNLLEEMIACSSRLSGMTARLSSGRNLVKLRFDKLHQDYHALGVHRGRLFQLLERRCKEHGVTIENGCKVTGLVSQATRPSEKLLLRLDKGGTQQESEPFDFLVAADGIRSAVRTHLSETGLIRSRLLEYDYAALWMTTKTEYRSDELFQVVEGTQKLIGLLPIGLGECSFFWGLRANEIDQLRRGAFEDWKERVIRDCDSSELLLQDKHSFDQFTFGKYGHVSANRQFTDQVILLGDAAHATSPHLGQGANLGLEDAFQFGQAIKETGNFQSACALFMRRRKRKIKYYQTLTRFLSPFFQSDGWLLGKTRNAVLPWLPRIPYVRTQMLRTLCGVKNGWLG